MLFLVVGALVLFAVTGVTYSAFLVFNPSRTASDRLSEFGSGGMDEELHVETITIDGTTEGSGITGVIGRLASGTEADATKQRLRLVQAGYRSRRALEVFNSIRVTLAIGLPMIFTPMAAGRPIHQVAFVVLLSAAFGYYGPEMYISNQLNKRQKTILGGFPDALDLLVSSVEAGLGLDAAFRRVASELDTSCPELARELTMVTNEISAGVPRVDAMRHMEVRTGVDEIRSLVNMIAQAERFGTSIAKGLRVHAKMTRQKRMSRAEEEAAKVSPKLTVVMILFLMPVLMSVLLGPAAIRVSETFAKQ